MELTFSNINKTFNELNTEDPSNLSDSTIPLDLDHYIRYEAFMKYSVPIDEEDLNKNDLQNRHIVNKNNFKLLFISIFGYAPPSILVKQMNYPVTWSQFSRRILRNRIQKMDIIDWYREVWREFDTTGKGWIEWKDWINCLQKQKTIEKEDGTIIESKGMLLPFRELLEECLEEFGSMEKKRMTFREFCNILEYGEERLKKTPM